MGWFSRRAKNKNGPASDDGPFDPEEGFLAVANAQTLQERKAAVRWEMLTDDFDSKVAAYAQNRWLEGDHTVALWAERIRMMLWFAREVGVDEALTALDPALPSSWIELLEQRVREEGEAPDQAELECRHTEALLSGPESASLSPYQRALVHQSLGDYYSTTWNTEEGTSRIDAALAHFEKALELMPPLECLYADIFAGAAMMQNKKFDRTASLRQIDLTIHNAESAITVALYGQLGLSTYHHIWAAGLRNVAELTDDAMYWEAAGSAFSQAAELTPPWDTRREACIAAAGLCLQAFRGAAHHDRLPFGMRGSSTVEMERAMRANPSLRERIHILRKNELELPDDELPQDLDAVITAVQDRLTEAAEDVNRLTLAQLLLSRYQETQRPEDLQGADDLTAAALANFTGQALVSAHLVRLQVLAALSAPRSASRAVLEAGMRLAGQHPGQVGLRLARTCADQVAEQGEWETAAEAYDTAASVHAALVQRQVGRDYQELALSWAASLGASAAHAHARRGDAERAAESLERGRAQLLSDALRRDTADLERLKALGADELADGYVSAVLRLTNAHKAEMPDLAEERAREDLDRAIADIRTRDGMSNFLRPMTSDDLLHVRATTGVALLYLAPAEHGGVAILVDDEIRATVLPDLTTEAAAQRAACTTLPPQLPAHSRGIDEATRWLGEQLVEVLETWTLPSEVALVPCGALGFLPVDAAWTPGPEGGRRYLFDDHHPRYAANAQALSISTGRASGRVHRTAALIGDPPTGSAPLPLAGVEVAVTAAILASAGTTVTTPDPAEATPALVTDRLGDSDLVHLACHARADHERPLNSGVLLAGDTSLDVGAILVAEVRTRLAVLSACESAAVGRSLPDEVVSLPAALVEGGCAGVVGSLWPVEDMVATLTMIAFYSRLAHGGLAPAGALHRARLWMREATNADVIEMLTGAVGEVAADDQAYRQLLRSLRLADPDDRPLASVTRWAAFQFVGA